jgi:NADH-quinone oxidoreductase subunit H
VTATSHAEAWAAPLIAGSILAVGVYVVAVLHVATGRLVAGTTATPGGWAGHHTSARPSVLSAATLTEPIRRAALVLVQQRTATERPDRVTWALGASAYAGLAATGLAVVPLSSTFSIADVDAGIVVWGTVEVLAIVAVFLHGWSANSHLPLIAAYRFVAIGLSYMLLSMFVLIAVAVPAESLRVSAIVESQAGLWNVVRQPLGLPLFAVVALGTTFWGPMNLADASDVAGGTSAEVSGTHRLVWQVARAAMLVSFSAMAAAVFLGGWQGPLLPGPVWMALKTLGLLGALVAASHLVARVRPERFVTVAWTRLLPLAFLDLAMAGVEGLL